MIGRPPFTPSLRVISVPMSTAVAMASVYQDAPSALSTQHSALSTQHSAPLHAIVCGRAVLLAQIRLQHLAHRVARKLTNDRDVLRRLERCQPALRVLVDL